MAFGDSENSFSREPQEQSPAQPLLGSGANLFEVKQRPRRDLAWLIAYLVAMALALVGGIFAIANMNTRSGDLTSPDPNVCPITAKTHAARRLLQQSSDAEFNGGLFLRTAGSWMAASAGGAVLVGLLFVWLVRTSPRALVRTALGLQVAVPIIMGIVALAGGNDNQNNGWVASLVLFIFAGVLMLLFWLWRKQIEQVTQLLGLAGHGLSANPGLVPMALALQVGLVFLVELPLMMLMGAASWNGSLAYNNERVDGGTAASFAQCLNVDGEAVPCCTWQVESWVPAYMALVGIAMTWSVFLAFQIKVYTVSGAIAQWYFAPRADAAGGSGGPAPGSRTLTAFKYAVGPSLGSLCAGAAVLTVVSMIRQAMENMKRRRNIVAALMAACLSLLLTLVEFVTQFATVRAAITGETFFAAGRNVVAMLKRNAMDAFGVWWLPPMILQSCSFILSLCWAVAVAILSYATTWRQIAVTNPDQAAFSAMLTAVVALIASWVVLGFLASIIISCVDALYICYAMDREAGQVTKLEVHDVISKLPTVGAVVQQPDGDLAYAAPAGEEQPQRGSVARV